MNCVKGWHSLDPEICETTLDGWLYKSHDAFSITRLSLSSGYSATSSRMMSSAAHCGTEYATQPKSTLIADHLKHSTVSWRGEGSDGGEFQSRIVRGKNEFAYRHVLQLCVKKSSFLITVVRRSHKCLPAVDPLPRGAGRPKFNQLQMVTTFTHNPVW